MQIRKVTNQTLRRHHLKINLKSSEKIKLRQRTHLFDVCKVFSILKFEIQL